MAEKNELAGLMRFVSPQNVVVGVLLLGGGGGFVHGNLKLDESLEHARRTESSGARVEAAVTELRKDVSELRGSLTELRTKVEASEKLALDTRLRQVELVGAERRLERIEAELELVKGRK